MMCLYLCLCLSLGVCVCVCVCVDVEDLAMGSRWIRCRMEGGRGGWPWWNEGRDE